MSQSITVAEFEGNVAWALRAASAGERVIITAHGLPIAELAPPRRPEEILRGLALEGLARLGDASVSIPLGSEDSQRVPLERILAACDADDR